jgi:DNA-binding beta-propeller fold protein YncE
MGALTPGTVLGGCRIDAVVGRGGMGIVYRARQLDLDRDVAVKVIAPELIEDPDSRTRFLTEARAASAVEHPNVIPVHGAGIAEGRAYLVMRYVAGDDLRTVVRRDGALAPERAAEIAVQLGDALDAIHQAGYVHRDVKPQNVMIDAGGHVYLSDFGLAKQAMATGGPTASEQWVGTLDYVAPEQIRGERVDARTDVYALGCVLVHALTGGAPFMRESDEATLWAHLHAPPPVDRVPAEFAGVVDRALAKDPADRFPSAGDLGRAALAAVGRAAPPGPERVVARGAAAPEGMAQTAPTWRASTPDHEGETQISPPEDAGAFWGAGRGGTGVTARGTAGHGGGAGRSGALAMLARKRSAQAAALAVLLAGALAAIVLAGGDDDDPGSTVATTTTPDGKETRPGQRRPTSTRPNSITIGGGRTWVLSRLEGNIVVLDVRTGKVFRRIQTRRGGTSIDAGPNAVWVLKDTGALLRIDARTTKRAGAPIEIDAPGTPISVDAGKDLLWVGVRKDGRRDGSDESLVKVDTRPREPKQQSMTVPFGVQDVAVGEGAVWVSTTFSDTVWRVDPSSLRMRAIKVGRGLNGIAAGENGVWVVDGRKKGIARISPRTQKVNARVRLGVVPTRVAVGGGSVWVTSQGANRLFRIDPRGKPALRETLDTGSEPFALDVAGRAVWVTLLDEGGGGAQRFGFYRWSSRGPLLGGG